MKISTREDIDAPLSKVFEAITDFDAFERQMLRRGIEINRDESKPMTGPGARWQARVVWRGRPQIIDAELMSVDPDHGYIVESRSGGVICHGVVDLVPLSQSRTRMLVSLDLRPTSLSSRLMVQSLKLAKRKLERRFSARVAEFAAGLEA